MYHCPSPGHKKDRNVAIEGERRRGLLDSALIGAGV
jgi:hypothetical protein